jgi:predicted NBD/HSP70 family sugar kinase
MHSVKATHQQTKEHNRDLVLKTIFAIKAISRAEIARLTQLTRPTVSDVVTLLINEGLVKEVGMGASIGGKSPILLSLVEDSRYMISLHLAHDQFSGGVVNLRGEIKARVKLSVSGRDGEQALNLVYEILDQLICMDWKPIIGIGVGTPGLVNTREGVVVNAVNLDWKNLPLAQLIRDRYQLPVHILNDSQAAAIGEYVYGGAHASDENLVVINVREGIGAGILINGRLFQGDGGGAGEIGHLVVQEGGLLCRCGNHGCLETIASTRGIVDRAKIFAKDFPTSELARDPENISLDSLQNAYKDGDALAQKVVLDAGLYLGGAIASLISTLNIQKFILIGDMTRFGKQWLEAICEKMSQGTLSKLAEGTSIEIGKPESQETILGASALMLLDSYSLLFMQ